MSKLVFIDLKLLSSNDKAPQYSHKTISNPTIQTMFGVMYIFKSGRLCYNFYSTMKKNSSVVGLNKSSWAGKRTSLFTQMAFQSKTMVLPSWV